VYGLRVKDKEQVKGTKGKRNKRYKEQKVKGLGFKV